MNVLKGDIVQVDITGIGESGEGLGKYEGTDVFVDGAVVGDKVTARIINVSQRYLVGRLHEILVPSSIRGKVQCSIVDKCSGCQIQQIKYTEQLKIKESKMQDMLSKMQAEASQNIQVEPILRMEEPVRYRSKGVYQVGYDDGELTIGFYKKRSHKVIDTDKCMMQNELVERVINILRNLIIKNNISVYDEEKKKGTLRKIVIRSGIKTGDIMICFIINGRKFPDLTGLANNLQYIPEVKSVVINANMHMATRILSSRDIVIWGDDHIIDYIGDIKYKITPLSFFPLNPIQTEMQHKKILEYADIKGDEIVWDAYCRTGSISLMLAKNVKKVYGVEKIKKAVLDARDNAFENGIENVEFFNGKTERITYAYYKKRKITIDLLILYPPRKGCAEKLLVAIPKIKPGKIIYISYSPTSMAEDLKYLVENGYQIEKIQPLDTLPHTMHVEAVVRLTRREATQ